MIESHAQQFAEEVPERPAGSQQEQIAATYILGHLQQAGYPARLDAVPVADLVRSTNVIAVPPLGADARYVVAVPYDTPPGERPGADAIGVFLEVARALSVIELDHPVEFVALGAEFSERGDGSEGSEALVQRLTSDGVSAQVVYLAPGLIEDGRPGGSVGLVAEGPLAGRLGAEQRSVGGVVSASLELYEQAGFEATAVGGDPGELAQSLVELLTEGAG